LKFIFSATQKELGMKIKTYTSVLLILFTFKPIILLADEMIIGKESYENYHLVFEAAPKDKVFSDSTIIHLSESETDIHIEALITWRENIKIEGQIPNSHIPYLDVKAIIVNEKTKESINISLVPHINLSDGFHYARNIKLPGLANEKYTVSFFIRPDDKLMTYHNDWKKKYGIPIINNISHTYRNLDFYQMSKKLRR
tara:strand:- start:1010 stop:1603 length:594 start_codon:yes stop_codon:yes gene_type:complete